MTSGTPRPSQAALALLAALMCTACGEGGGGASRLEAVIDTVEGVERFRYPEAGAPALAWRLDTATVIGGYGVEDDAFQFSRAGPGGLAGNENGDLFVLDFMGKRVLGFDETGASIAVWGREGGGPGELQMPTGLGVGPGDTLWVADPGNQRLTLLPRDPAGTPASLPMPEGASSMAGGLVPSDGGAYGLLAMIQFRPGDDVGLPPRPLIHLRRDGSTGDTVWNAPAPQTDQVTVDLGGGRIMMMLTQRAFSPDFWWDRFAGGRFALAQGADYEVRLVDPDGSEALRIQRDPPPRPTIESDRQAAKARMREEAANDDFPGTEQMLEKRLEAMTFAEVIPRITGLVVDGRDRLWVGVSEESPGKADRIDVYDRDGRLIGEILHPPFFPDLFYGDGLAAHLTRDELDVDQIVVARLVEGDGG